jgi:flagellar biogenesis protein FliO
MTPGPEALLGQLTPTPAFTPAYEGQSFGMLALQMFVALAVVCLIAVVSLRVLLPLLASPRASGRNIQVIERQRLEGRRSLLLVRALGRILLLGSSEAGIHLLCEFEEREAGMLEQSSRPQGPQLPFKGWLARIRDARGKGGTHGAA